MRNRLWEALRGHAVPPPISDAFTPVLPKRDAPDTRRTLLGPPAYEAEPISGYACIIDYVDGFDEESSRRITCHRVERERSHFYVAAYCHERSAPRRFRIDRIREVIDLHTGEACADAAEFFGRFRLDRESDALRNWGLSVQSRGDFAAALNALVFMGRCDMEWHPLEREAVEAFISSYWIRRELTFDPPVQEILDYADRLAPDAEAFFVALERCGRNRHLGPIIQQHLRSVVDADGVLRPEEVRWGSAVDRRLQELRAEISAAIEAEEAAFRAMLDGPCAIRISFEPPRL